MGNRLEKVEEISAQLKDKYKQIRELQEKELNKKLADLKEELFNLRFQHAINQLDNPQRLKAVKKDIARVKTILREIELKGENA